MIIYAIVTCAIFTIYHYYNNKNTRHKLPKHKYELYAAKSTKHYEEFVHAPGTHRKGQKLYRQIWSPLNTNPKALVVFVHGINAYSGRLATQAIVSYSLYTYITQYYRNSAIWDATSLESITMDMEEAMEFMR